MKLALVGDIGGTNARFALWKNQQLQSVQVLATADHASPEEAISLYLSGLGLDSFLLKFLGECFKLCHDLFVFDDDSK